MENQNDYIIKLIESGLSIIPINEGMKSPHFILGKTHNLLKKIATTEEAKSWVAAGVKSWGLAGGEVSGNLVTLDFDEKHYFGLYDLWYKSLSDDQKKIVDSCHKNQTRNKGTHIHYRTQTPQSTEKLARKLEWNEVEKKEKIETTAETKAEGGYALIPPSTGYTTTQGSLLELPIVPDEIHNELIDVLRRFEEIEDKPITEYEWKPKLGDIPAGDRPGDRFNMRATWEEILEPHGWKKAYEGGWTRSGKDLKDGISATTDYDGHDILYVFSSSAHPFIGPHDKKKGTGYTKFHAYALLNHNGDFSAAAKEIVKNEGRTVVTAQSQLVKNQCDVLLSKIPRDTPKQLVLNALIPLLETLASGESLEGGEIYIRNKVKDDLDLIGKDIDSIIKYFKKLKITYDRNQYEIKKKLELAEEEKPLTESEIKIADEILKSPTLLYDILKMVKKLGVVGEEKNVLLHYIIFTSRKLKHPLSATVKGDSSSGKSFTLLTTIKLLPKSAYIDLTDATPQSFFYCPEDHFKHKIIVIFEKHGGERADYAIRTLQSEGKLKIQVTIKNPETGQFEAQTIEKEGPTGFVTTTTASFIHAENDTRNISMFPDQSSEQTGRVYESVDSRYLGKQPISEDEIKPWQNAQLRLEEIPVSIPFVKSFRKHFPKHIVRTRRDYGHFLAVLEAVAFLHQKQRSIIEISGVKYIRATLNDAYIAKTIVEDTLSKSIYELPEKTIEVIGRARKLDGKQFTITELSKELGWDRDTVAKWMKPGVKKGYLSITEESKGSIGAKYIVEEKELPGDTFLPSIPSLLNDNPDEALESIYNPITGESISIESMCHEVCTDVPMEEDTAINTTVCEKTTTDNAVVASEEDKSIIAQFNF